MDNLKTLISHYIIGDPDGHYLEGIYSKLAEANHVASRLNRDLDRQGDEGNRYCVGAVDHNGDAHFDI